MVAALHLMLRQFYHFIEFKRVLEIRLVLQQSTTYNTITVQVFVFSKSIRDLQSYRSLSIQSIARVNFKQQSFNVLQEKLNLANNPLQTVHCFL